MIAWIDLEGIMLSEIGQTEKDTYYMISLICEIKKNKINEQNRKKFIDSQNKLMVAK